MGGALNALEGEVKLSPIFSAMSLCQCSYWQVMEMVCVCVSIRKTVDDPA